MTAKLLYIAACIAASAIFISLGAFSQELGKGDLITDPAISRRCKNLLEERRTKIQSQQRLHALMRRNEKLLKKVPQNRDSIRSKLEFTHTKIKNNIRLSKMKLQKMEEDIVRRGCPGVVL